MKQRIAQCLEWLLLAPALLPLVYVDGLLYPFVAPKTLFFRALGILALAAFSYLALSGHEFYWNRLRAKLTWIPAVLLVVAYVTSIFGVDFYRSFWSVYDRGDGLLTLSIAVLFFYLTLLYADRKFLRRLFTIVSWVATLVSLYVIVQWLGNVSGIDFAFIEQTRGRIGGTLGNAAFLAGYLGMTMWVTLARAGDSRGVWRTLYVVGATLQFFAIVLAATRGTLLALAVVLGLALLYCAWKGKRFRLYARVGVLGLAVFAGLFFTFRSQLAHVPIESVRRVASISLQDETVSSRLFVWQHTLQEGLKRPFTGYGAEHIEMIFDRVYDPGAILEQWFDRTHNAFLDYFIQFGVLGAFLYASIIAMLGYVGTQLLRRGERYGVYILLLACVYAIQNFFVFDTSMTLWLLFVTLSAALAHAHAHDDKNKESPFAMRFRAPQLISYAVPIVLLILLYPVAIEPLRANILLAQGYTYHVTDVARAISDFQKGLSLHTYADLEYGYQAYSMYTDHQQTMLKGQERVAAYNYALDTLKANYQRYPYDARTAVYLAHVLDSAPPEEAVDETFLRSVLTRAMELSPKRSQAWYILINIPLKKGDASKQTTQRNQYYREAIGLLEEYSRNVPTYSEPRFIIASLYVVVGDLALAKTWAAEGLELYKKPNVDIARRAIRYYLTVEDWPNSERFMRDILAEEPDNLPLLYDFAKVRFLQGNREEALSIVRRLRIESPGLVESDPAFLKSLAE